MKFLHTNAFIFVLFYSYFCFGMEGQIAVPCKRQSGPYIGNLSRTRDPFEKKFELETRQLLRKFLRIHSECEFSKSNSEFIPLSISTEWRNTVDKQRNLYRTQNNKQPKAVNNDCFISKQEIETQQKIRANTHPETPQQITKTITKPKKRRNRKKKNAIQQQPIQQQQQKIEPTICIQQEEQGRNHKAKKADIQLIGDARRQLFIRYNVGTMDNLKWRLNFWCNATKQPYLYATINKYCTFSYCDDCDEFKIYTDPIGTVQYCVQCGQELYETMNQQ